MSLTGRLVLVIVLSLLGVGAATAAALHTHWESDAVREADAEAQSAAIAEQLRAKLDAAVPALVASVEQGSATPAPLARFIQSLLAPLSDASAGYCASDGTLIVRETVVPQDLSLPLRGQAPASYLTLRGNLQQPSGLGLLPLDRDAIASACRAHVRGHGAADKARLVAPRGTLFLTVSGGRAPFAAWALVRTPPPARSAHALWRPYLLALVIALSTIALVVLCIDTVLRVRRGIDSIAEALHAAQADLATPIPQPATRELTRIADGLRTLTSHLFDARNRELTLERTLSHARRLASLGRVAAGVAHEVRNPLASIKLRLDAMSRRGLDERNAHDVSRCLSEVSRLDSVVHSLLLVARKNATPHDQVDLGQLVDERMAALESLASDKPVSLTRSGGASGQLDATAMTLVIDNLLRNSLEASPAGAAVVVELGSEGADLLMRVVDEGAGIPEDKHAELFEPFFTSKPTGTGLGLSLSRAAVEAHGGSLTYSREGSKTWFSVRLPGRGCV